MKALTIRQPWASLIMIGAKPYHYQRWTPSPQLIEERIVIYAHPDPMIGGDVEGLYFDLTLDAGIGRSVTVELGLPLVTRIYDGMREKGPIVSLPLGVGLGSVMLGRAVKCTDLFPDDPQVDPAMWAWPLKDPQEFRRPIRAQGGEKFWSWPETRRAA